MGITDSDTTPIARYCKKHLIAGVVSPSFLNSYVSDGSCQFDSRCVCSLQSQTVTHSTETDG